MEDKKQLIINTISDALLDLFYYDRKEDNELPVGAIEEAIINGVISIEEIVALVDNKIRRRMENILK